MNYTKILDEIEIRLKKKFECVYPRKEENRTSLYHLLYMVQEIRTMKDPEKASRWIGWLSAIAITKYEIMKNEEIDKLIRANKNERRR